MSLPSQSSRNATRSSQVHYRRSRSSPIRRIGSILAILIVLALVWFTLIRPGADTPAEPAADSDLIGDTAAQTPSSSPSTTPAGPASGERLAAGDPDRDESGNGERPTVINNSPGRPLPGAGDRPDPQRDVDRALGTDTTTNTATRNPRRETETDILSSAADQGRTNPAPTQPQNQPAAQPSRNGSAPSGIRMQLDTARRLIAENDRIGARALLSRTLINADLSESERQTLRDELTTINNQLVFSAVVDRNDPMTEEYRVQSGDSLSRIAARRELATHWKLIARVNGISDPAKIRLGQTLKLVRGPFHAIVDKSDHRVDLYHGPPADHASWIYIRSFDVGLGTDDGTPVGEFVVSSNKLENPGWVNPRNAREQYAPSDPENPIGEYWIGLTGVGDYADLTSYGIHGTIDPDSIGGDESMGCVRLADEDIDVVYELLAEHVSRVLIVP